MDGIINVYKETGYTSFDVVAKLRSILHQKKIGHTGTLDPMAEGVLLVCLGSATKLVDVLTLKDKCYRVSMQLGIMTDTEDITGTVICQKDIPRDLTKQQVIDVLHDYVKSYDQIPPMYSAIKKDGKKLYEYARAGISVERTPRNVTIFSIDDIVIDLPVVSFNVHCSKGTYVRSLCRDIGDTLGTGATMSSLVRQEVNGLKACDALRLSQIEKCMVDGTIMNYIISMDSVLQAYKAIHIKNEFLKYLVNGNKLYCNQFEVCDPSFDCELFRVYAKERLVALYQYRQDDHMLRPYKMFLNEQDLREQK